MNARKTLGIGRESPFDHEAAIVLAREVYLESDSMTMAEAVGLYWDLRGGREGK